MEQNGKGIFRLEDILNYNREPEKVSIDEVPQEKEVSQEKKVPYEVEEVRPDSIEEVADNLTEKEATNLFNLDSVVKSSLSSDKNEVIDPEEESEESKTSPAMESDVKGWLEGIMATAPPMLSQMMSDVSNKMATYVAYVLVQRLSHLDTLVNHLNTLEKRIFSDTRLEKPRSVSSYKEDYKLLSSTFHGMLEFTRKFATQSSQLIKDPMRDEVMQMLRSLDVDSLKDLKEVIKSKIQQASEKGSLKREE